MIIFHMGDANLSMNYICNGFIFYVVVVKMNRKTSRGLGHWNLKQ